MIDKSLAGRCGLNCGYCSIHRAYKDSERLREEFTKPLESGFEYVSDYESKKVLRKRK